MAWVPDGRVGRAATGRCEFAARQQGATRGQSPRVAHRHSVSSHRPVPDRPTHPPQRPPRPRRNARPATPLTPHPLYATRSACRSRRGCRSSQWSGSGRCSRRRRCLRRRAPVVWRRVSPRVRLCRAWTQTVFVIRYIANNLRGRKLKVPVFHAPHPPSPRPNQPTPPLLRARGT